MSTRFVALWGSIGAATAVGVVAGARWRRLEDRRSELNKEYELNVMKLQAHDEQRAALVEQQKQYSAKMQRTCATVDTLWVDRLQRYRQANRDLHAYLRVLPEVMGVFQGLSNHCRHLAHEVRPFVVFDVACAKIHSLSLLLDHARNSGLRSVADTIQRLYAAEPLVHALCDTVALTSTAERLPNSVHECSDSFQFCIQELNEHVRAAMETHMPPALCSTNTQTETSQGSTAACATPAAVACGRDGSHTEIQRSIDNKINNSDNTNDDIHSSTSGSVWGDVLTRLLDAARVDLLTESQRKLVHQRLQLQRQLERERYQLHTVDDVRRAVEYCDTVERYLGHSGDNTAHGRIADSVRHNQMRAPSESCDGVSAERNARLVDTLRAIREDVKVQQSLQQLRTWSSSTAQYLIQDQALQALDCYLSLLSTTLTHVNDR